MASCQILLNANLKKQVKYTHHNNHLTTMKKPTAKPQWLTLAVCAGLFLVLGLALGKWLASPETKSQTPTKQNKQSPTTQESKPVMAVETISPITTPITQFLSADGVIVGKTLANVGAKSGGLAIEAVMVDVGDTVKAGQILAKLDDKSVTEELNMVKAELTQARASLDKASADLSRVEPLLAIDAISREQYDAYKTAKIQAQATLDMLTAKLANVQNQQQNSHVIAPVSGLISEKNADVGMLTGSGHLFSIIKDGTLEWQGNISPTDGKHIQIGQLVELQNDRQNVLAKVSRLSPVANASRELTVHATLEPNSVLHAGMYQTGQIILSAQNLPTLPQRVITRSDGMDYVWTLSATDKPDLYKATRQKITLGNRQGDMVAVDLPTDALVIKEGGNFLQDGDVVQVVKADEGATP